jgi:hypothetical protein
MAGVVFGVPLVKRLTHYNTVDVPRLQRQYRWASEHRLELELCAHDPLSRLNTLPALGPLDMVRNFVAADPRLIFSYAHSPSQKFNLHTGQLTEASPTMFPHTNWAPLERCSSVVNRTHAMNYAQTAHGISNSTHNGIFYNFTPGAPTRRFQTEHLIDDFHLANNSQSLLVKCMHSNKFIYYDIETATQVFTWKLIAESGSTACVPDDRLFYIRHANTISLIDVRQQNVQSITTGPFLGWLSSIVAYCDGCDLLSCSRTIIRFSIRAGRWTGDNLGPISVSVDPGLSEYFDRVSMLDA